MNSQEDVFDFDEEFGSLPTLSSLAGIIKDEEVPISSAVLESLLEDMRAIKEELNDYHIRDAEMEGWMSIPRNRYLRLLGLELENRDLLHRNEFLEEELREYEDHPTPRFTQPPESEFPDPFFMGTDGTAQQVDPNKYRTYSPVGAGSSNPMLWQDTSILGEDEVQAVVDEVMRKIRRGE